MMKTAEASTARHTPSGAEDFDVYGYRFRLTGDCQFAIEGLREDFGHFRCSASVGTGIELELRGREPDYDALPPLEAAIYTPRNAVYRDIDSRILDFGGRGLGQFRTSEQRFLMESLDPHLVYEAGYLFLLSQIGQYLDAQGLHRLHALAMSYKGRSILVLLPMGGGKSTLGAALLQYPELKILSDDSPIISRRGNVHSFPLRLGLLKGNEEQIPEAHRRLIHRMEFGPKYLVNYSYFAERVEVEAEPGLLLVGKRTLATTGRLEPVGRYECMKAMVANMIVGLGLFQGLEYLLQRSSGELVTKAGLVWSRFRNAYTLVRRSHRLEFHMGRDVAANARLVLKAAKDHFG